ncbi:type IV pilus modification PilV family protein [Congregibacter sp.]|uniref:type IV pilus modification PilV family protein n=1 Tax=Congregibacter sp. TaxID=2744308 RepID=UPI003F6D6FE9
MLDRQRGHRGFLTIDLLLAVLVFSTTASGLLSLQLDAMRNSEDASRYTRATLIAWDQMERNAVQSASEDTVHQYLLMTRQFDGGSDVAMRALPDLRLEFSVHGQITHLTAVWSSLSRALLHGLKAESENAGPSQMRLTMQRLGEVL